MPKSSLMLKGKTVTSTDRCIKAIGARLAMRETSRELLVMLKTLTDSEFIASGWEKGDLAALRRLATMPIDGFP